ncbi:hypothetical protein, partial [Hydrogenophaga sp.]|uniref:hypothetical protein n=1 Tax=Hydrogenophaga sp. TaxID=1904254 RepID=UPI0027178067
QMNIGWIRAHALKGTLSPASTAAMRPLQGVAHVPGRRSSGINPGHLPASKWTRRYYKPQAWGKNTRVNL